MPITAHPVAATDWPIILSQSTSPYGDLPAPALRTLWPAPSSESQTLSSPPAEPLSPTRAARLQWSVHQQQLQFESDPTARFVKAVATGSSLREPLSSPADTEEIVALARWHYYPNGWDADSMAWREVDNTDGPKRAVDLDGANLVEPARQGLKTPLLLSFIKQIAAQRDRIPGNRACWVLTTVITRPGYRRQGAAGVLLEWGFEQADRDGLPVYLEASAPGPRKVYEAHGFRDVGFCEIDSRQAGGEHVVTMYTMERPPRSSAGGGSSGGVGGC